MLEIELRLLDLCVLNADRGTAGGGRCCLPCGLRAGRAGLSGLRCALRGARRRRACTCSSLEARLLRGGLRARYAGLCCDERGLIGIELALRNIALAQQRPV